MKSVFLFGNLRIKWELLELLSAKIWITMLASTHTFSYKSIHRVTKRGMATSKYRWSNFDVKLKRYPLQANEETEKKNMLDSFIRVDHAGEVGAKKIYEGQLAALKGSFVQPIIQVLMHTPKSDLLGNGRC
jgi:hypothetical protein